MSSEAQVAAADHGGHGGERGFAKLDFELNDYPGPLKTALFGIQHVLVMFTAMVGGPLIVSRLLNLPDETRIAMVSGTMIGCGIATMISALGLGFIGLALAATVLVRRVGSTLTTIGSPSNPIFFWPCLVRKITGTPQGFTLLPTVLSGSVAVGSSLYRSTAFAPWATASVIRLPRSW